MDSNRTRKYEGSGNQELYSSFATTNNYYQNRFDNSNQTKNDGKRNNIFYKNILKY